MPKTTLAERMRAAIDHAGVKQAWLEEDAELPKGYVSRILNGERKRLGPEMLARISKSLKVELSWLSTGDGKGLEVSPAQRTDELSAGHEDGEGRWFSDEIEALALQLARQKGAPEYTYPEMKAAKVFAMKAASMLSKGTSRFDLLASAAEAARQLSAGGQTPTADLIFELLVLKNKPTYVPPPEHETELEKILRQGREEAARANVIPRKTADATPRTSTSNK